MIIHLGKNINVTGARELYENLVDQYIDLKADVDVRLFLNSEDIENNKKKNLIFSHSDEFLKKNLFA